ncbi:MAG: type III-A CRISPR-associated protein Cas10/Csm1 [Deltaproteobacteria bacterium]|nr:type III-A CRISPR-associated protein Cas10/Csm1 [Deltaproteobacteria bacterium]
MDQKKQAIILGALLHDIGKFMQRAEIPCRYEDDLDQMQVVCKYHKDGGYFTHKHSLWTTQFFEEYQIQFPALSAPFNNPDDNIANFASKHHNPHTPLQWIIAEADRLSSGMDRLPGDEEDETKGRDGFKKVRLLPILEEVSLQEKEKEPSTHAYELTPLSIEEEMIFPRRIESLTPKRGEPLVENYKMLWDQFIGEFSLLPNENFFVFLESLLFLLEKYTWCIPSSTVDLPDISLFDHAKTTAAIGACLYDYHYAHESLEEGRIRGRDDYKYLLVCGDLSGIQRFIYNITSKGAAKGLKGRSFYLQLLADATGKCILRSLGYSFSNLLYASGGKFYLLVSNGHEHDLIEIGKKINEELLQRLRGEIYLSLGWCQLRGRDFLGTNFPPKWQEAAEKANNQKRRKFSDLGYDTIFRPFGKGGEEDTCQICKGEGDIKPRREDEPDLKLCRDCQEKEDLGERLSKANYLVEVFGSRANSLEPDLDLPFLEITYFFSKDLERIDTVSLENTIIYRLNSTEFLGQGLPVKRCAYGFRFVGGTRIPMDVNQTPKTFNDFAEDSTGLKRLGILRMDVDSLGRVFSEGFGQKASISRVATLSRSLSLFFNGYLNTICQKKGFEDKTYIIYSGGDDLFIVGAWNTVVDLAEEINNGFTRFCCDNPDLTLSGGIALVPAKYPIYRGARHAGDAEKLGKDYRRKGGKQKNAIAFLGKPLGWQDFAIARAIKDLLYKSIKEGKKAVDSEKNLKLSKGILDRLRKIFLLYETNRTYCRGVKELSSDLIEERLKYHKWVWRSVYSLGKAVKENEIFSEDIEALQRALFENKINGLSSEREVIEFIDVPTRWAEFLLREEEGLASQDNV